MRSPLPASVIIECPHCGTRYQVPGDTIGPRGRQVQCAHCSRAWQAVAVVPDPVPAGEEAADRIFDEEEERELDAAFAAAERAAAVTPPTEPHTAAAPEEPFVPASGESPPSDAATPSEPDAAAAASGKSTKAFNRRQKSMARRQPLAQFRRLARLVTLSVLALLVLCFLVFRTEIVRAVPDLAGTYEALGLGVNVVGLEFGDFNTVLTQRDGVPQLRVDARIDNVSTRNVTVPPVVISLIDTAGNSLYEWSVQPEARDLEPNESVDFSTQLNATPVEATQVRLSFASGRSQPQPPIAAIDTGTP
ncbi:MAG TPA: MJ0042-type zinc finger domain-containing protein [Devosiaceae bacterium]|jgi:predicted Zn finger-like uncharacterized protein|nr:MJ0042-type zinc finger domain-containing protein [Devosiaceae bacterium]